MDELAVELSRARREIARLQARYDTDVPRLEQALAAASAERAHEEKSSLLSSATFGSFDGMTSVAGIVFALANKGLNVIVLAAIGLAVASAVGMAAGEYLGDSTKRHAYLRSAVMGLSTAVGTLVPTIPFFVFASKTLAFAFAGMLALILTTIIGHVRAQGIRGYVQTYAILTAAIGATVVVSLLIPSSTG